jgi:hypothetical protein
MGLKGMLKKASDFKTFLIETKRFQCLDIDFKTVSLELMESYWRWLEKRTGRKILDGSKSNNESR